MLPNSLALNGDCSVPSQLGEWSFRLWVRSTTSRYAVWSGMVGFRAATSNSASAKLQPIANVFHLFMPHYEDKNPSVGRLTFGLSVHLDALYNDFVSESVSIHMH